MTFLRWNTEIHPKYTSSFFTDQDLTEIEEANLDYLMVRVIFYLSPFKVSEFKTRCYRNTVFKNEDYILEQFWRNA